MSEPISVVPPVERPNSPGNLGLSLVSLPARLLGGTAIQITRQGLGATVSLDIGKLSVQGGIDPATTWVACWTESGHHFRVPINVIPSDAPLTGLIYGRQNGAWVDLATSLIVDWDNVADKPATFPPTLPIAQSDVVDLPGVLIDLQNDIDALALNIPDQPTAEAGVNNTEFMTSLRTKQQIDARRADISTPDTDDEKISTPEDVVRRIDDNVPVMVTQRISREKLLRYKLLREIPYYNSVLVAALTTYSYPYLHPQALAVDLVAGEIWMLSAPATGAGVNDWGWFSVYDIATGARKTTFTLAVKWSETAILQTVGNNRYLWTFNGASFVKADVSILPADGSTLAPMLSVGVAGQNGLGSFDGSTFSLQIGFSTTGRRETFGRFDTSLTRVGTVEFPACVTGQIHSDYINFLPKAQGVAAFNGGYAFGCGGPYTTGAFNASQLQGVQIASEDGTLVESALCAPDKFLSHLSTLAGRTLTIVENEGVSVSQNRLFGLWMVQPVATRLTDGLTGGVLITEMNIADDDAVSCTDAATMAPVPFNRFDFDSKIHVSSAQLTDPVNGAALNSFDQIANMIQRLNLAPYRFLGTNQVLTDCNGQTAPGVSSNYIEFSYKGTSFDVWIKRARDSSHYVLGQNEPRSQQLLDETPHEPGCAAWEVAQDVLEISSPWIGSTLAATSAVSGQIRMMRVPLSPKLRRRMFTKMGINVTTVGTLTAHLGVYADNGGRPGALLLDAGVATLTATGAQFTPDFTAQAFDYPAIYLACETDDTVARVTRVLMTAGALGLFSGASISNGISRSRTFSPTFPPDETASTYSNTTIMPLIWLQ